MEDYNYVHIHMLVHSSVICFTTCILNNMQRGTIIAQSINYI